MAKKAIYRILGALGIVIAFVLGLWLGRLYSAAGGPGVVALQQLRSTVVRQVRQLWEPSLSPTVTAGSGAGVPRISPEQLKDKLDAGADMVIVDVSSKEAFDEGHITGAVSMSWGDMAARHIELPRDKEIITYCSRCSLPEDSVRAAQFLIDKGFSDVRAMKGEFARWQEAGYPVEK